jgi:hypothetical protein
MPEIEAQAEGEMTRRVLVRNDKHVIFVALALRLLSGGGFSSPSSVADRSNEQRKEKSKKQYLAPLLFKGYNPNSRFGILNFSCPFVISHSKSCSTLRNLLFVLLISRCINFGLCNSSNRSVSSIAHEAVSQQKGDSRD